MIRLKPDVCIIGSGIAGLIAALECAKFCNVLIVTKNNLSESNSIYAQGGIAAPISNLDSPETHYEDTLKAGCFHNNKEAVKILTENANDAITDLINYGVKFDKTNNKLDLVKEGAHSIARVLHSKDLTGLAIMNALIKKIKKNKNISILENTSVDELIVKDNSCIGCYSKSLKDNYTIQSKFICISTGGSGYLFEKTSNPKIATGDGLYLAYEAGCRLIDLEFIQFHPTGFNYSNSNYFLISEALRGSGAKLINSEKVYFMKKYHTLADLAPRDIVSRAIYDQLNQNKTVYLDCRSLDKDFIKRFPTITKKAKENNINLPQELLPITPVVHYIMGGILTNINSQTDIKNLYAIGEVACNGLHGANRLASNSLLEGIVFAKNAANSIKKSINTTSHQTINTKQINTEKITPKLVQKIQDILWENCGIIRTITNLEIAKNKLENLSKYTEFQNNKKNTQWIKLAYLFITAALNRKENCGSHFIENQKPNTKYWITQCKFKNIKTHKTFPEILN